MSHAKAQSQSNLEPQINAGERRFKTFFSLNPLATSHIAFLCNLRASAVKTGCLFCFADIHLDLTATGDEGFEAAVVEPSFGGLVVEQVGVEEGGGGLLDDGVEGFVVFFAGLTSQAAFGFAGKGHVVGTVEVDLVFGLSAL